MHQMWSYIVSILSTWSDAAGQRSTATRAAVSVRTRMNLGRRAFSVAGPSVWKSLPSSLRLIDSHEQFRQQLKTYYFNVAFLPRDPYA